MNSVGHRIRSERIGRGITLEQLSENTKIPIYSLEYIESDRFSELPNDIVVKGFIKSICQVLKLNDETYLKDYNASRQRHGTGTEGKRVFKAPSNDEVLKSSSSKYRFLIALIIFLIFGSLLFLVVFTPSTIRGSEKLSGSVENVVNE